MRIAVLILTLFIVPSLLAGSSQAQEATPNPDHPRIVGGNATEVLPEGSPNELAVLVLPSISYINEHDGWLPFVFQNTTESPVARVSIIGSVKDRDNRILSTNDAVSVSPKVLFPGDYGFGVISLDLGSTIVPDDATIEFLIESSEVAGWDDVPAGVLQVVETNVFENRVTGTVRNPNDVPVTGPISIEVVCLDDNGRILQWTSEFHGLNTIAPGADVPYQVTLSSSPVPCPYVMVASDGF